MEREYIGIDLHKAFFHACAMTSTAERRWEQRWPTSDAGIAGLLARCNAHSYVAVEASSPTWSFVDRIVGHVGAIHVVDTRKTRIKAGYAAKTDRLDARRLADALRRDSVVGIYYPPPAIRDLRELARYRCHLARLQVSLKQRIGELCRAGAPRRTQRAAPVERPHYQGRLAVAAVGVDRGGDPSVSSPRRVRPLGTPPRGENRHVESARRRRACPVHGCVRAVAPWVNLSRVDGRRRHGHPVADL
jgi:transposase